MFDGAIGNKDRKPDLEAACRVQVDGGGAALLLGSGSLPTAASRALRVAVEVP